MNSNEQLTKEEKQSMMDMYKSRPGEKSTKKKRKDVQEERGIYVCV